MKQKLQDFIDDLMLPALPGWMVGGLVVLVALSWLPLAVIAYARTHYSSAPPIHIFQGMDNQVKYKAQATSDVFADGRAMRPQVPGTVAIGHLYIDDHYDRGFVVEMQRDESGEMVPVANYFKTLPEQIEVDMDFLLRGKKKFNAQCYTCHGKAGMGDGPTNIRATELQEQGLAQWAPASNLMQTNEAGQLIYGPELYEDGKLYNVITHGIRNMKGYASSIETRDRWAIVAYIRAMQLTQGVDADLVPEEIRSQLD